MIELENFCKEYKKLFSQKISFQVQDVSFCVEKGQIVGLVGANGAGKTTILKAIAGLHYPTSGKIYIGDSEKKFDVEENPYQTKKLIGYVPEKSILPKNIRVIEFLDYVANLHELSGEEKKDAIDFVVKKCSLKEVLNKKIKELSKGYAQRVSFAQALIFNPPNLILDEPFSGLDPAQIIQIRQLILDLAKQKSILISTHILQEVHNLCNKVAIMNNGELKIFGSENQINSHYNVTNIEEAFLKIVSENYS